MRAKHQEKYQGIFVKVSEKARKKGGSLGAIFKLIQELAEFEDKIEECAAAQEMTENASKISDFLGKMDQMYEVLFEMARGGIGAIRNSRGEMEEGAVEEEGEEMIEKPEKSVEVPSGSVSESRRPSSLSVPTIPRM